jgi:hypothetical protein
VAQVEEVQTLVLPRLGVGLALFLTLYLWQSNTKLICLPVWFHARVSNLTPGSDVTTPP